MGNKRYFSSPEQTLDDKDRMLYAMQNGQQASPAKPTASTPSAVSSKPTSGSGSQGNGDSNNGVVKLKGSQYSTNKQVTDSASVTDAQSSSSSESSAHTEYADPNSPEYQKYLAELNRPLEQAYNIGQDGKVDSKTMFEQLGLNPEYYRKQREKEAEAARIRAKISGVTGILAGMGDIFSAVGGNRKVKVRDKDNTAKEAREQVDKLRELQAAEDAANARLISQNGLDYAKQKVANIRTVNEMLARKMQQNTQDNTQHSQTAQGTRGKTTQGTSTTSEQYIKDQTYSYLNSISNLVSNGVITREQGKQLVAQIMGGAEQARRVDVAPEKGKTDWKEYAKDWWSNINKGYANQGTQSGGGLIGVNGFGSQRTGQH